MNNNCRRVHAIVCLADFNMAEQAGLGLPTFISYEAWKQTVEDERPGHVEDIRLNQVLTGAASATVGTRHTLGAHQKFEVSRGDASARQESVTLLLHNFFRGYLILTAEEWGSNYREGSHTDCCTALACTTTADHAKERQ
ncbi:hypothetical protein [Arthrobacter sp. PAMC25284]|uniref:hypothetical protein n=1 Tax=Arthrobacter sp. PAMC25284 TaxID=2861279 RepID=UPI001C632536|nr:hypothetical protein [Arthrobacter sp. PAMC25284]QYF88473.1 hypothetical protein KY499_09230 [Arthrobacter sp. PAMC25284]